MKMVKNKRDVVTPTRRASLTKKQIILDKAITKVSSSRPASAASRTKAASTANIKVVVRVRPPNTREQEENNRIVVKVINDDMLIFDPEEEVQGFFFHGVQQKGRDLLKKVKKNMEFFFDKIFSTESTNVDVFKDSTYSLISSVMDGYNCSVFAYGATGAGKTFTMTGTSANPGITFLTMMELFRQQEELSSERDFELGITYLEVYNELVKDLLNPGPPLNLREDSNYGVIVAGIKVFKISKADELFQLLKQGNHNRTQHPTDANAESSRSHAVFQVYIKMTMKTTKEVRTAKLSMIDLAGSERGSATGYGGARFTEGANINKSLLALGNCINSLADGQRHVPYRDSKLTRLLKDSLGGNCRTVMIANVSPSSMSFEDTYNTLKYATRAKKIKSSIHMNVAKMDLNVVHYVKIVAELTEENQLIKQQLKEEKEKTEMLEKECQRLRSAMETASSIDVKDSEDDCTTTIKVLMEKKREPVERQYELEENEGATAVTRLRSPMEATSSIDVKNSEDGCTETIKVLMEKKRELLERQFELEKHEDATTLRRLLKEEIDGRLSDICRSSPEKQEARDKINSTITRFKKQEHALRDDIEKTEDNTDEIDKQIDDFIFEHPECKQYVKMERMKLALLRARHRILLEQKHSEALIDDQEEKTELLEKMAGTIKYYYKLLHGHGCVTSNVTKQYQEITQSFLGRKNIKWGELPDSGISSGSSMSLPEADPGPSGNKRKMEADVNRTFSLDSKQTKSASETLMVKGSKPFVRSPAVRKLAAKSVNKENVFRKPFDSTKMTSSGKSIVNSGLKAGLRSRPTPLSVRPRFKR